MPIYEYRCTACGDEIEVMQKISDRPLRRCRKCSGKLEKLVSRTSFQLKGGGWYASGYSKTSGKAAKKSSGDDTSGKSEKKGSDTAASSTPASQTATA